MTQNVTVIEAGEECVGVELGENERWALVIDRSRQCGKEDDPDDGHCRRERTGFDHQPYNFLDYRVRLPQATSALEEL